MKCCIRSGIGVQAAGVLGWSLLLFWPSLGLVLALMVVRAAATNRYRTERREGGSSRLGTLGKSLANTPYHSYTLLTTFSVATCVVFGVEYLRAWLGPDVVLLPLAVLAAASLFALILFVNLTVRGSSMWRKGRIVRDHQRFGHQDWVLEKYLAQLQNEISESGGRRKKVAERVLSELMKQEDMTGDAVRRIMGRSEGVADTHPERKISSPFWDLKFTLLLLVVALSALGLLLWASTLNTWFGYEVFMLALPVLLLSFVSLYCCFCIEVLRVSEKERRLRALDRTPS